MMRLTAAECHAAAVREHDRTRLALTAHKAVSRCRLASPDDGGWRRVVPQLLTWAERRDMRQRYRELVQAEHMAAVAVMVAEVAMHVERNSVREAA